MTIIERFATIHLLLLLAQSLTAVDGFTSLSMVASGAPRRAFKTPSAIPPIGPTTGITSGLISQLAVVALKKRLKEQTGVVCDVNASSADLLLRGRVGPVTVKGRGWASALGLTCRAIEATVNACELDVSKIISLRKLKLVTPAKGQAMVALNGKDFASFITHPLMKPPGLPNASGDGIHFLKDDVDVNPTTGVITFYGEYSGQRWRLQLQRAKSGPRKAIVSVEAVDESAGLEEIGEQLTATVSDFFNNMVFELDGTFLNFKDMMMTGKGGEPTLLLALDITVRKFPSPGLQF